MIMIYYFLDSGILHFPAAAGVRELHDDCKTGDEAGAA